MFTVSTTNDSGAGSLRQAILDANADHGPDTIAFAIGGGGVQTIRPTSPLPTITAPVTIDGTTQPGYAGTPLIVLNGDNARVNGNSGLTITGGNSVVRGLVVNGFVGRGILVSGGGGDVISGNYLGTDASGTAAASNAFGIDVESSNNTIGGTTAGSRNLISGNVWGVSIQRDHNVVEGNYIGTDVTGATALGNVSYGVGLAGPNNTVGGPANGLGNVISANQGWGVFCGYTGADHNVVEGNYIGTDATGTIALGNGAEGVILYSANNTVGGTNASARNLISGNGTAGVRIKMIGADQNIVEGNYIGTDVTGNLALGNPVGVDIEDGNDTTIGGAVPGAGNLISGNGHGVDETMDILLPQGTLVQGNFIGTNAAGTRAVGNRVGFDLAGPQNTVGGTSAAARNVISGNSTYGITAAPGSGVLIQGNYIGTDAAGNAALGNGTGIYGSASLVIGGSAAGAGNVISGNASYGIGLIHAGGQIQGNRIGTNAAGTAALGNGYGIYILDSPYLIGGTAAGAGNLISGNLTGVLVAGNLFDQIMGNSIGTDVSGTRAIGNGDGVIVEGAAMVGGTLPGAGNLISGNTGNGIAVFGSENLIEGNFIGTDRNGTAALGNGTGMFIGGADNQVGGTVPAARNVISGNAPSMPLGIGGTGILISGPGATGNRVQGNFVGTNAAGTAAVANFLDGISLETAGNTVGGTATGDRNVISGNRLNGIYGLVGSQTVIQGNYIGTDVTGTHVVGNQQSGIVALGDLTIGGSQAGDGNLISGNSEGIILYNGRNVVQGNWIGTDSTGTIALGNQNGDGIGISSYSGPQTIGGTVAGARNLISGNRAHGIALYGGYTTIQGNWIGTDASGTAAVGNGVGISLEGFNDTVGGTVAGAGNVVSGNRGAGIMSSGGNLVEGNRIGTDSTGTYALANGGDGIDSIGPDTIGGTTPGAGNVISGNTGNGVGIFGGVLVQGNRIGVDVSGTNALGNGGHGVLVSGLFSSTTIGGTVAGVGNVIADNGGDGVRVDGSTDNTIRGNAIYGHAEGLGIDLVNNGNYNQPAPVLTDARSRVSRTNVTGTLTSRANSRFTLEFFGNTDCNPSGYGEGQVFLGTLAVMTDAAGNAGFKTSFDAGIGPGQFLTATATDSSGNTSAFSRCLAVRTHGQHGNTDRSGAPRGDADATLRFRIDDPTFRVAVGTLADVGRNPVGWDAAPESPDVDQAPRIPGAGEGLAARFGSDLFFSSFGRDGADGLFPGETSAGPVDGAWESALSLTGGALWGLPG